MGHSIKQTSDSYGVTGAIVSAKNTVSKYGQKAAEYTAESGRGIIESAKDGSLQQKTTEKAYSAGNAISSFGHSLYKNFPGYSATSHYYNQRSQEQSMDNFR